jgi:MoaD family protein
MDIEVSLFGKLRDIAGVYKETVNSAAAANLAWLVDRLEEKHGSDFAGALATIEGLRILVNGREYQLLDGMETPLKDKDSVVLLPPIEGG